jgi:phage terminase large subunit GpA-like protein
VSQWADERGRLITATGRSVQWQTREPQRAILDSLDHDRIEQVTLLKSSRFGWSSLLMAAMGYFIDQDPSPIAMVQPRIKDLEEWSKEQVQPAIDSSPILSALVSPKKHGVSGNTIDHKEYPGGPLRLRASNSPDGFRRWAARIGMCDEIDGYPLSAGPDGDVISLLWGRLQDAWNRTLVCGSTPTEMDISMVWRLWLESSKGYPILACPHCGEHHIRLRERPKEPIILRGKDWPISTLEWDPGKPQTAHYACPANGCVIEHRHHADMLAGCWWDGEHWRYRERKFEFFDGFEGHIGFSTWAGYIISPNTTPAKLAARWERDRKRPETKKVYINTVDGMPWEEEGESLRSATLIARAEPFAAEVPAGGVWLSAGVDVQVDRWEFEVVAWGPGEESWSVDYQIIPGDPTQDGDWDELLRPALSAVYRHESGVDLPISAIGIDHGYLGKRVAAFCTRWKRANLYALKGMPGEGRPLVETHQHRARRLAKRRSATFRPELMGDWEAKKTILDRLRKIQAPGPGYSHFPDDRDKEWFEQLTAEKLVTRYVHQRPYREWIKLQERNEALDCRKMAMATMLLAGPDLSQKIEPLPPPRGQTPAPAPPRRGNFVNAWRR